MVEAQQYLIDFTVDFFTKYFEDINKDFNFEEFELPRNKEEFLEVIKNDYLLAEWCITEMPEMYMNIDYIPDSCVISNEDFVLYRLNDKFIKIPRYSGKPEFVNVKKTEIITYKYEIV